MVSSIFRALWFVIKYTAIAAFVIAMGAIAIVVGIVMAIPAVLVAFGSETKPHRKRRAKPRTAPLQDIDDLE